MPLSNEVRTETIARVADAIERSASSLERDIVSMVELEVPAFRQMTAGERDLLKATVRGEIGSAARMLRGGSRVISIEARQGLRALGEGFAERGTPLQAVTRLLELTTQGVSDSVISLAMGLGEEGLPVLEAYFGLAMDHLTGSESVVARAYIDRARELAEARRRFRSAFLADVIAGNLTDGHQGRAAALGLKTAHRYGVLLVPVPEAVGDIDEEHVDHLIAEALPDAWWARIGRSVTVVVPMKAEPEDPAGPEASALESALRPVLGEDLVVAVGPASAGLGGIRASFTTAASIAETARLDGRHGVVKQEDVAVKRFLLVSDGARAALDHVLEPLLAHDRAHGGQLVETLDAYLDANLSVSDAARSLDVHRNTLRYRLEAIKGLLGTEIAESRLALKLALLARELSTHARGIEEGSHV